MRNLRIAAVTIDSECGVNRHPIAPPDVTGILVEGFRCRAGELCYRHQDPIRGAEPEVRPVERFQSALEMDTAGGGSDVLGTDRRQFVCNERLCFLSLLLRKNRMFAILASVVSL